MTSLEKSYAGNSESWVIVSKYHRPKGREQEQALGLIMGGYQISDGNYVVAGWCYDLTLRDVENWVSDRERNIEWMISGGGCE